ncbi:DUF6988 family protein [Cognatilysobacter segetis]|uniref:DUF6988 family protein n=1 Tax=Cognatilysobacter segetis TaxID=2492394 RepID=UPI0010612E2C|nr:hypothetical protein [Lysobacter segetis]
MSLDLLKIELERSAALEALVDAAWEGAGVGSEASARAAAGLCSLSLNHGRAIRLLLLEVPPSATALMRPQFETLVRAVWARHAAKESDLARLLAQLTVESQQAAKKLPGVPEMLAALGTLGPRGAAALLGRARARLWDGLNSHVHGGIHPFQRGESGYPTQLLSDLLKNTNAMTMLTVIMLAELTGNAEFVAVMSALHHEFADVLPELEPLPT